MLIKLSRLIAPALLSMVLVATLGTGMASAHERRDLGQYRLVVGFNTEPALQGEPNGAQITVTVPGENNRPVEGLGDSLKLSVAAGGSQPKEFPLRSVFGTPGRYVADFIPTRPGSYIFTFTGAIEGQPVNERFESGPGRFDEVKNVESLQFPETVPPGNDVARLARNADDHAADAAAAAESARTMAIIGMGVGVVGLLFGIVAVSIMVTRRASVPAAARR